MNTNIGFPPHITENDKVILFDGVCKLCNGWARFVLKYDCAQVFKLASVQSQQGQDILKFLRMSTDTFDTMLYIEGRNVFKKSTAFLNIIRLFPNSFKILYVLRFIPVRIRDWFYDRIALNRYFLFGKHEQCLLPDEKYKSRFL